MRCSLVLIPFVWESCSIQSLVLIFLDRRVVVYRVWMMGAMSRMIFSIQIGIPKAFT